MFRETTPISEINEVLYSIFAFSLVLDLIAVFLINASILRYFYAKAGGFNLKTLDFYIPISGFLWIFTSLAWRLPFFTSWGFNFGLKEDNRWFDLEDNAFLYNFLNDHLIHLLQVLAAIFLLVFLVLLAIYIYPIVEYNQDLDIDLFGLGREKITGILNLSGLFFLVIETTVYVLAGERNQVIRRIFGTTSIGMLFVVGVVFKLLIVPLFVILTCLKMIGLKRRIYPEEKVIARIRENSRFKFKY